jgi:hypothetical protein
MFELLKKTPGLKPSSTIHSMMAVEQGAQQQWRRIRFSLRFTPSGNTGLKKQPSKCPIINLKASKTRH